jgi:hypothetical protein
VTTNLDGEDSAAGRILGAACLGVQRANLGVFTQQKNIALPVQSVSIRMQSICWRLTTQRNTVNVPVTSTFEKQGSRHQKLNC